MNNIGAEQMRSVARNIQRQIPGFGFCLIVFELNKQTGMSNFVSNANRDDMILALEEMIENLKNDKDFKTPEEN